MADALDAVLNLVQQHNAQQQLQTDNLNNGVQLFNQQMQNAQQNRLSQLQIKASLAANALQLGPDGSISYNSKLMNPAQQIMLGLNGQAAAKSAGNPQAYQLYSGLLSRLMNGGTMPMPNTGSASPSTVSQNAVATPQLSTDTQSSGSNQASMGNYPITANGNIQAGTPDLNKMLTLGQSSTTDPISGVTSTSQNQVNLPAQAMQATQAAQIPNQVAANKAAAEAQTQAASGASDYKNIYGLAKDIDQAGYLGNPVNTTAYKLSARTAPGDVQSNISELQAAIKRSSQSSQIADTATYGEGVAKRMSAGQDSIGLDSTLPQIKGWVKGNITSDYYKEIGTQQFAAELAKQGLNPNQVTPDQFGAGVMKYWGKLNPAQNKELQTRIMSTLAPKNAAGFSIKTGKYYDNKAQVIKE